jgi:hypothetical protein
MREGARWRPTVGQYVIFDQFDAAALVIDFDEASGMYTVRVIPAAGDDAASGRSVRCWLDELRPMPGPRREQRA